MDLDKNSSMLKSKPFDILLRILSIQLSTSTYICQVISFEYNFVIKTYTAIITLLTNKHYVQFKVNSGVQKQKCLYSYE